MQAVGMASAQQLVRKTWNSGRKALIDLVDQKIQSGKPVEAKELLEISLQEARELVHQGIKKSKPNLIETGLARVFDTGSIQKAMNKNIPTPANSFEGLMQDAKNILKLGMQLKDKEVINAGIDTMHKAGQKFGATA